MHLLNQIVLLFGLNVLDALLTIVWVRSGVATEGNHLMAELLDLGNLPFLAVKIGIGMITALVLFIYSNRPITRVCLAFALIVYGGLMGVHFVTGLFAFGYLPAELLDTLALATNQVFAIMVRY